MRAQVDEEDMTKVRVDQDRRSCRCRSTRSRRGRRAAGRAARSKVACAIYDQADPDRRTFEVDVSLAEPDDALRSRA